MLPYGAEPPCGAAASAAAAAGGSYLADEPLPVALGPLGKLHHPECFFVDPGDFLPRPEPPLRCLFIRQRHYFIADVRVKFGGVIQKKAGLPVLRRK